ncbi:hypothetical protein AAC387_Pa04g2902 [Persea americana]
MLSSIAPPPIPLSMAERFSICSIIFIIWVRNVRTYINITITSEEARSVVHAFERESWSTAAIDVDAANAFEIMSLHIGGEGLDGRWSCEGAAQGGDEFVQKGLREGFSVGKLSLSSKTMKRTMLKDLSVEIACLTNEGIIFQKQERFVFTVVLEDLDSKIVGVARNDDQNDKILAIGPHTSGDPAAQNPLSAPSRSSSITSACYYCSLPNWPARSR